MVPFHWSASFPVLHALESERRALIQLVVDSQPHSQLTSKLVAYAATNHRVHLLDCSRIYLDSTRTHVSPQLMPGGLHPSKAGEDPLAGHALARPAAADRSAAFLRPDPSIVTMQRSAGLAGDCTLVRLSPVNMARLLSSPSL